MREKIEEIIEQSFDVVRIGNKVYYTSKSKSDEKFKRRIEELLTLHGVVRSKSQIKTKLTVKPKEKLEQLLEEVRPHCQYWDCRNDVPLDENHDRQVALICIDKQLELLRYLGGFKIEDLYDNLVKQKELLK